MSFDYYAFLEDKKDEPEATLPLKSTGLVSGFVDECVVLSCAREGKKNNVRQFYMSKAPKPDLRIPPQLTFEPVFSSLPSPDWLGFEIDFTLKTPWYSKDDRPFHVLDNPVRKDWVFGVPFMAASSWKGLLRGACRMQQGLLDHLEKHKEESNGMEGWQDAPWIIHLFGNERRADAEFRAGALAFYPTWFSKIGFEVINPHSRKTKAGTQPIYYEVVPPETKGVLRLLYAPVPAPDKTTGNDENRVNALFLLIEAIKKLLPTYGISAKRTAGWGTAQIGDKKKCKVWLRQDGWMGSLLPAVSASYEQPSEEIRQLLDDEGKTRKELLAEKGEFFSNTTFKHLQGTRLCILALYKNFRKLYKENGAEYRNRLAAKKEGEPSAEASPILFSDFCDALKKKADGVQKEGAE